MSACPYMTLLWVGIEFFWPLFPFLVGALLRPDRDPCQLPVLAFIIEDLFVQAFVNNVIGFFEAFAAGEGVNVVGDVLKGHTADDASDEATTGEAVEHGKLFCRLHWMTQWENVTDD